MVMVINNVLLYNAALSGYAAGMVAGAYLSDATQADYDVASAQARAFALEVDGAIPTDTAAAPQPAESTGISQAGGAAISPPGSSGVQESQALKTSIMWGLAFAAGFQKYNTGATAAQFATQAAATKAFYFSLVLQGSTP